jgi:hypothetical protein
MRGFVPLSFNRTFVRKAFALLYASPRDSSTLFALAWKVTVALRVVRQEFARTRTLFSSAELVSRLAHILDCLNMAPEPRTHGRSHLGVALPLNAQ